MRKFIRCFSLLMMLSLPLVNFGQAGMIVHPGTSVTLESGYHMDIGGAKLLIMDDYSDNPSFLQSGSLSFSGGGSAFVEQYTSRDVFHMVSSPMSDETIEVYLWKYLERYHENTDTWEFLHLPLNIPMPAGEGFFVYNYTIDPNGEWPSSGDSVVFNGTMNYQDIDLMLSNTDATNNSGWNLLGNPFPVSLEWNGHADWNLVNLEPNMYVYNSVTGTYEIYNYFTGLGTNPNDGFIAATQGFWVRADDTTGVVTSLTIPASQRTHTQASFLKSSNQELSNQLFLTVSDLNSELQDKAIIGFIEDATSDFESKYDGAYYPGLETSISMYSVTRGINYVLNELPSVVEHKIVSLNFETPVESRFVLEASMLETFDENIPVYLEDKQLGIFHNFKENPSYIFNAFSSDDASRFTVHFAEPQSYDDLMGSIDIYSYQNRVIVEIPFEVSGDIVVFDVSGRTIHREQALSGHNEFELSNVNGNFIIQLLSEEVLKSKLVYIQ